MHPKALSIADFIYDLPPDRIAKYPLPQRDMSKLLVYHNGVITEDLYVNISNYLPGGCQLVFNQTKVVEARLLFKKPTGGTIEIFCLEPHEQYPDITTAMLQKESVWWKCLIGGASKWKHGMVLHKKADELEIEASIVEREAEAFIIQLKWNTELSFAEVLHKAGVVPLPPYLNREAEEADSERYQTIYAREEGSVAAPTAGLHFTGAVFNKLEQKNIHTSFVTLHVGAGTFKPVKSDTMEDHEMHAEFIDVELSFIDNLIDHLDNPVIAVGTTSLRTIESLYWIGVKLSATGGVEDDALYVHQWDPYELETSFTAREALQVLVYWMNQNKISRLITRTQIIIAPGYQFKIAKALVTNFHQPQSTLLLLVAALLGDDWKRVYNYALEHSFRFLSYGDGSLLWLNEKN